MSMMQSRQTRTICWTPDIVSGECSVQLWRCLLKNQIFAAALSATLLLCSVYSLPALADDQAFEDYSKRVSEEIAKRGDSAEDYYENQEKEAGKLAAQESTEEETEAAESRVDAEDTSPDGKLSITSFHGFPWRTSEEDIRKEVILPDMENTIDYSLKGIDASGRSLTGKAALEKSGITTLGIKGYSIGGYDATSFYVFEKKKLTGGVYEFFMDQDAFLDLTSQCTLAYGAPTVSGGDKDDDTHQPYALWVDSDSNFIFAALSLGIMYGQKDSALLSVFSDGIQDTCGIDIEQVIAESGHS